MGIFWDLIQQSQISETESKAETLEKRVVVLEDQLYKTQRIMHEVLTRLEHNFGQDLDDDGRVG
jgi:chaperonin cofactor prefoldin